MLDNSTAVDDQIISTKIPKITAFSIMFVSIGMSCFIWQTMTAGWMFYKARKPIIGLVFFQAFLGILVTFVTLLTSLTEVDCTFRLLFSIIGVNIGDITLQFVLLWKAYLGNNRSKLILIVGCVPILAIASFICANMTIGKSTTSMGVGLCDTNYPISIVVAKTIIDCTSNTFLSGCFILVIYRHYRILGSVFDGSSPIIYTIDWYLASYLIIKQLRYKNKNSAEKDEDEDEDEDEDNITIDSITEKRPAYNDEEQQQKQQQKQQQEVNIKPKKELYHYSIDGTLIPSPSSDVAPYHAQFDDEHMSGLAFDSKQHQKTTILISPPIIKGQASLFLDDDESDIDRQLSTVAKDRFT
ncbi:MAG: hypothetical protein EXX96DRAFT_509950 [Benjaminiella poitrasii]|nr:MAG: hypothetical protein EXX96DRAFT_509950 [Benjaminiella poitrasii]